MSVISRRRLRASVPTVITLLALIFSLLLALSTHMLSFAHASSHRGAQLQMVLERSHISTCPAKTAWAPPATQPQKSGSRLPMVSSAMSTIPL